MTHSPTQEAEGRDRPVRCGRVKRPDLFDVLKVVREWPGCQSYVYGNKLRAEGHRAVTTALVLARLKKLEALGRVRRRALLGMPTLWTACNDPTPAPTDAAAAHPHQGERR